VPDEGDRGVWEVRVLEKRGGGERVVGRFSLEVSGISYRDEGQDC
jgi:hypothetical protein